MPTTLDLTPEQQASLDHDVQDLEPTLTSPVAKILHARGETKKACRIEDCAKLKSADKYDCGYINNVHTVHCHCPICYDCAAYIAKKWIDQFTENLSGMIKISLQYRITWVELHVPCDDVKSRMEEAKKSFLSLFPGALEAYESKRCINLLRFMEGEVDSVTMNREITCFLAGLTDTGEAIIRLMLVGVDDFRTQHNEVKAAFPYASQVIVCTPSLEQAPKFVKFLFAPAIPKDPERQADMAIALAGIRRLDYLGQTKRVHRKENAAAPQGDETAPDFATPPEPKKMLTSTSNAEMMLKDPPSLASSPQSSSSAESPQPTKEGKKCPHCGAAHVGRVTFSADEPSWRGHPLRN